MGLLLLHVRDYGGSAMLLGKQCIGVVVVGVGCRVRVRIGRVCCRMEHHFFFTRNRGAVFFLKGCGKRRWERENDVVDLLSFFF